MVTDRHDRGQLILITAIAIAFIILALVIVFNGLLFTQTIASEDASKGATDVKTAESELEEGIQGVVLRSNLEGSDWKHDTESFVSDYQDATSTTKPVIVGTANHDEGDNGWRLSDDLSEDETKILNEDDARIIGHLVIDVEYGNALNINDQESDTLDIDIVEETDCEAERFDLMTGLAFDSDDTLVDEESCDLDQLESATAYEKISIDSSGDVSFILVASGDDEPDSDIEEPEWEEVPWSVEIDYSYDSSDVTYDRTLEVEVYEDVPDHVWPGGGEP